MPKRNLRQMRYKIKRDWLTTQNTVLFFAIILCVYFLMGAISSTSRNWNLQAKLQRLELSKARAEIEVEMLKLEQEYYQTEEYQELMAREKLGRMLEGETMVILAKNSEDAIARDQQSSTSTVIQQSNASMWLDLIFGQ